MLLAAVTLSIGGCASHDMSDLHRYVAEVKRRPAPPLEPIPEIRPYEPHAYPEHGENPFDQSAVPALRPPAATIAEIPESAIQIDRDRPREHLEQFPLDSLRMVGRLDQSDGTWALIRSPDRVIHRVTVGNHLGQNHGLITAIGESQIELVEIVPDGFGGYKERDTEISLSESN
jgi:type IV pilus assembly protein PilP